MQRPLHEIARESLASDTLKGSARSWATPYLQAMLALESRHDSYGMDDGKSIILYALSNLTYWRGDLARSVKAELNAHLKDAA